MKTQMVLAEYQQSLLAVTIAIQLEKDQYHNSQSVMTLKLYR